MDFLQFEAAKAQWESGLREIAAKHPELYPAGKKLDVRLSDRIRGSDAAFHPVFEDPDIAHNIVQEVMALFERLFPGLADGRPAQ
jgi:hypothetical protein